MKVVQLMGIVVILFILFSCTDNTEIYKSDIPEGSINMRLNVQKRVADNLLLEVIELNDNRCPVGTVCDHAGKVEVKFRILTNKAISTRTISFNDFRNGPVNSDTILGHLVELVKVTPYPYEGKPMEKPENYTISIKVE